MVFGSGLFASSATVDHMFVYFYRTCGLGLRFVGVRGFEPPTSRTRTIRAKLALYTSRIGHFRSREVR